METIRNSVQGTEVVHFRDVHPLQGELKSLSKENYNKLKKQILKHGITSPLHVWDDGKKLWALDGHQRCRAYGAMAQEGYSIGDVPIVRITAPDIRSAKQILLGLASQFGKVESDGLFEFLNDSGLEWPEAKDLLTFPEINLQRFEDEHFRDMSSIEPGNEDDQGKLDQKKPVECPECGHEFVPKT